MNPLSQNSDKILTKTNLGDPFSNPKTPERPFSTIKIPLAHKNTVEQYRQRGTFLHPHIPAITIDSTSPFYLTVHLETVSLLSPQKLVAFPLAQRIPLLRDILKGVTYLVNRYGFFYLEEGMLGHRGTRSTDEIGEIWVWISDDLWENTRKLPIEKGRFSEETFVTSFKATFMAQIQRQREFHEANTIALLLVLLEQRQHIHQSLFISQYSSKILSTKDSLVGHSNPANSDVSVEQWRERANAKCQEGETLHFSHRGLKKSSLLSSMARRGMSTSYLNHPGLQFTNKKLKRTNTYAHVLAPVQQETPLFNSSHFSFGLVGKEKGLKKNQPLTTSCSKFSTTNTIRPLCSFDHAQISEMKSYQLNNLIEHTKKSIHLDWDDISSIPRPKGGERKSEFPQSTTSAFFPQLYGDYGSKNLQNSGQLSSEEQIRSTWKKSYHESHGLEDMKDMEMELDCLFSESDSEKEPRYDVEGLENEFQSILGA